MERLITSTLVATLGLVVSAQSIYIPPDYFGEEYKKSIGFWRNMGQVMTTDGHKTKDVLYYSEGGLPRAYLRDRSQVSFVLAHIDTSIATMDTLWRLDMRPFGPHAQAVTPVSFVQKDWTQNFYLPWCGDNGVTGVPGYCRVAYRDIFPKIDMHFYSGSMGQKMVFVMRPGCDPSDLKLKFTGQDSIKVDLWGTLKIYYDGKFMEMPFAQAYQVGAGNTIIPVSWMPSYNMIDGTGVVSFQYSSYDPSLPLVFQLGPPPALGGNTVTPGVCWATYIGNEGQDRVSDNAVDANGNSYITGVTYSAFATFANNVGQNIFSATPNVYLARFDQNDNLRWYDYISSSNGAHVFSVAAKTTEATSEVYIAGVGFGTDFYHLPVAGAYNNNDPGSHGFIAKFNYDQGLLTWSTHFGDWWVRSIAVDSHKRLVAIGSTSGGLPVAENPPPGSANWPYSGNGDGYVALFTEEDNLLWSTYLGGAGGEEAQAVAANKDIIVVGGTSSDTLYHVHNPGNGAYFHGTRFPGLGYDVFLYAFNEDGILKWGTFVGGNENDIVNVNALAIAPDNQDIYICGNTGSTDLPISTDAPYYSDTVNPGAINGWISQFDGNNYGLKYMTLTGGPSGSNMYGIVALADNHFFVVGGANSNDFPIVPLEGLYNAGTMLGAHDAVIMAFAPDHQLVWSTYFGGEEAVNGSDALVCISALGNERIYIGGSTSVVYSINNFYPLTNKGGGAWWDEAYGGGVSDAVVGEFCIGGIWSAIVEQVQGYPPPAITTLNEARLLLPAGRHPVRVLDATGRLCMQKQVISDGVTPNMLDLAALQPGSYWVCTENNKARRVFVIH
ncbi:MAG TPA: hypothetical protein PLY76_04505 [Flavobacteriales bacterium]|nr:hypothetical protein [Flavobacteriales bacterium]HRP81136.1 hypothetical protein [Flavobacteriales bacterium]